MSNPPAFASNTSDGMTLRDWFATFAPEPTSEQITQAHERDCIVNPHNDTYKPQRRTVEEIIADIKFAYADAMLARRKK